MGRLLVQIRACRLGAMDRFDRNFILADCRVSSVRRCGICGIWDALILPPAPCHLAPPSPSWPYPTTLAPSAPQRISAHPASFQSTRIPSHPAPHQPAPRHIIPIPTISAHPVLAHRFLTHPTRTPFHPVSPHSTPLHPLHRYDVSVALPIEYGTVTAIDVLSGLVFYKEYEDLETWRIATIAGGCVICILGIAVGMMDEKKSVGDMKV